MAADRTPEDEATDPRRRAKEVLQAHYPDGRWSEFSGPVEKAVRDLREEGLLAGPGGRERETLAEEPLLRAPASEAALRGTVERWARAVRERAFGSPAPPFSDLEEAREEWVRPATEGMGVPSPTSGTEEREEALERLREAHRRVEEEYGVRLREPVPVAEVLELADRGPGSTRLQGFGVDRIPVSDATSPHYAVARACRAMAEYSGHRRAALTRYVLTGAEPELPAAVLEVRAATLPSPSEPAAGDPSTARRHAVVRLNEPLTAARLRNLRDRIGDLWEDSREAERRALREVVERTAREDDHFGPDDPTRARRAFWEAVQEEWNRGRPPERRLKTWRALQMRYAEHFVDESDSDRGEE